VSDEIGADTEVLKVKKYKHDYRTVIVFLTVYLTLSAGGWRSSPRHDLEGEVFFLAELRVTTYACWFVYLLRTHFLLVWKC
jgi:hypothetical protein